MLKIKTTLAKLVRFYPIVIALAIVGALATFISTSPNQPALFSADVQGVPDASALTNQSNSAAFTTPRKTPAIPTVNADNAVVEIQLSDLMYGQQVRVNDGARYYESADLAGSGRQGTVGNRYTEILRIAGFATVDPDTGHLVEAQAYTRDAVPTGQKAPSFVATCRPETIWIALCTDGYDTGDIGWVSVFELNWQDCSLDILPELENGLSNIEDTSNFQCNPYISLFYFLDEAYALDHDKVQDFCLHFDPYQRHIWATGSILIIGGEHVYWPERKCLPYDDSDAVKHINDWVSEGGAYRYDESTNESYVWADYDPYIDELYGGILSRPFHGKQNVLIIVTDTHARNFANLTPSDAFDKVVILDVSPEYEVEPDFSAQVAAAYGSVAEITEQDIYAYSLKECLEAFS